MTQLCALCNVLAGEDRPTGSTIGLTTALPELLAHARERFDGPRGGDAHIVVAICPEHVVDVYRGRVAGVSMAWRAAAVLS